MGIVEALGGGTVYLDANVFIYALEGYSGFVEPVTALFDEMDRKRLHGVTSELTLAEVLVKPMMVGNSALQQVYEDALRSSDSLSLVAITRDILVEAARLRAGNGMLRLPDAIHVATAMANHCDAIVTNDQRLSAAPLPRVLLLSQFAA